MKASILFDSKRLAIILFLLSIVIYGFFVFNFEPHTDDEFLGEQLYWLVEDGHVRSNLMSGFRDIGIEETWTVFHKGIIYYGYVWSKLFGWSIYALQGGSILLSVIFLFLLWIYFQNSKNRYSSNAYLITAAVCLLFYYFTWSSTRFRPEILELLLGFITYLQLSKYLDQNKKYAWIFAAISAGLAMLAHINGFIIIFAGFILLLFNKKWLVSILFGSIATITFLTTYFADVFIFADLGYFQNQFFNDPALNPSHFHWYSPLIKIPTELSRYFHADVDSVFTFPFLIIFILSFRHLKKERRNMIIYMLSMMIILSFYTYNKKTVFMVPIFPYMAILFVEGAHYLVRERLSKLLPKVGIAFFVLYFLVSGFLLSIKTIRLYESNIVEENKKIGELIGKNNRVLAEGKFIFHEIKNQSFILNETQFTFFKAFHGEEVYNMQEFIEEAVLRNLDYIVLKKPLLDRLRDHLYEKDERYNTVESTDNYAVIKINK